MLRISIADRLVFAGERPLALTSKFFQLYCLAAYQRAAGGERFLTCRDVHRLSRWNNTSLTSVGKAIHRHIQQMRRAGSDLLESPPKKTTQLFRLRREAGEVSFDLPLPDVRAFLGLDLSAPETPPDEVERAFRFATALACARVEFERGHLREARAALEDAERAGSCLVRDRIQYLVWWSRVQEREGNYRQAVARAQEAVELCAHVGVDYLTAARALIWLGHLGWMSREPALLGQSRGHYLRAQGLLEGTRHFTELAQIATGLGHLARRAADWSSAHSFFLTALRYASAEGWAWGIQAALCNLGLVCAERGDHVRSRDARARAYREAQAWEARCIEFADRTGIGRDSTEAVSILAEVLLKLGKAEASIGWSRVALERARAAGNRKSEAIALACLGQGLEAAGKTLEAADNLRAASRIFRELERHEDLEGIRRLLEGRRITPPLAPASARGR